MKTTYILAATVAFLLPTFTSGLVGISWSVTGLINEPSSGLTDITFPFSIGNAPHRTGYFFAQQFGFNGQSDVGYTGLQTRPDSNGRPIIHAVFTSFISGTTTDDANCQSGADGGPGVSCAVEFSAPYAGTFNLEVVNTEGTKWRGAAVDAVTGKRVHIGSYTLPAGTKGIKGAQDGFIEYYPWNDGQNHPCNSLPYTSVVFGVPMTTTIGAIGSIKNAFEYGDCVGQVGFKTHRTIEDGVEVSVGF
jgi:hypothetical protein